MKKQEERLRSIGQSYEFKAYGQGELKWSTDSHNLVINGMADLPTLSKLKNVILSLRRDWSSQISKGITIEGKDQFGKRLLLAEGEIESLLKRKINYSVKDENGGERVLDYSSLLNEKENQIIELEKKIQNFEEKLRRAGARESELENHVVRLTEQLKRKQDIISLKHNSAVAEVAASTALRDALNKIKKNIEQNRYKIGESERLIMDGVVFPEVGNFDIKSDIFSENTLASRSRVYQQQTEAGKYKIRLAQFFREFERLVNQSQGITDFQVERVIEGFLGNMNETKLYEKMQFSIQKYRLVQDYKRIKENFSIAAGIFAELVSQLKADYINYRLPPQVDNIFQILQREKIVAFQVVSGAIFVDLQVDISRTIEVPVQDARTKHLIHLLAHQLKRLFLKFPKLQGEIDVKLAQFLQQEIIDVMDVDQIEKLIQIVKFVPQIVRVENVYTHCTQKQRKMEFHLRILIKALLEELEKIKLKTGITLEIDEGVVGMIKAEIMDVVNVDDILKVFRVTPKIVQVQKIVQKIVERVIEIPKVVTVEKIVEKIVQVEKIKEVERIVHVPIDKPLIVETQREKLVPYEKKVQTIVEVPTIVEKLVELQKIVPQVMEVEVIKEKIVEVQVPVQVQRVVNHIQTQLQQVQVFAEKIVTVEKIIQKIVEVPVFVQKIVEKIVQVPKVIEVERIVQKIVPVIEYRSAREVENHIEVRYEVVDRIIEKIVPIIQIKQRIKEVPRQIQVIKQVNNIITEIKEVEVIREKLVIQEVIKQVERVETRIVETIRQVIKEVEKYIEVPIIKEVAVIKQLIVEKPIISRIESVHIKEVIVKVPVIVKEPVIVEVEKFINVYIQVPKTIKYIEEKIVEVPTIIDRIKQIPVIVEKIIEKMVEVPKVVEVQKIVEKVVVVPRVIEKVVEVPQIIEKVIQKEVIREKIIEVQRIVHVPVIKQVIKEVETVKNIYIQIEKPIQTVVQKTVEVPKFQQKLITKQIIKEVPITVIQEVPVQLQVEKIVPISYECVKPIEIERQIIVPFEIPVPVSTIVEKIVPKEEVIERIIPVPQIIQKIVPVVETKIEFQQIERVVQRILIEKQIKEVEKIVPYIQEVIKEVPTMIEKIVTIEKSIDNIVTVQRIIEKVIEKTITLPQVYEVERIKQKLVEVPKLIEIQRIVPQIIKVNQYIHKIVEKLIEVPTIIETMKEVVREQQKIVPLKSETTEIVEVEKCIEKLVYVEKLKEVVRNVNYIEKVLQIIDRIEQVPVAITTTEQKFIEVPYILEKIVEKIIVMPQIVEVLKYVHEVCETENIGVAVDVEFGVHQMKYKELSKNIEIQIDLLLKEFKYLKSDQTTRNRIEVIQRFIEQLRKFILVPRIVKVVEQKIIEREVSKDRLVQIPIQDEQSLRKELSLSILVQKLISELKRVKGKSGINLELDDDIKLLFFSELGTAVNLDNEMVKKLQSYTSHVYRQFESLGSWTVDHQLMLNSFLQERFLMAELIQNANFEIEQAKTINKNKTDELNKYKGDCTTYGNYLAQINAIIAQNRPFEQILAIIQMFNNPKTQQQGEKTYYLADLAIDNERIDSLLRQKDAQINALKESMFRIQQKTSAQGTIVNEGVIQVLKQQIDSLRSQNSHLLSKTSQSGLLQSYKTQITDLQSRNLQLEGQISRLRSESYNLKTQRSLLMQNISFRREPDSSIHQVDIRQSGIDRSRISQQSQGINLASRAGERSTMPQYLQSTIYQPRQSKIEDTTGKKIDISQPYDSRYSQSSQSGVRNIQYATGPFTSSLSQSGVLAEKSGQYQSISETGLYQSQSREPNQPSSIYRQTQNLPESGLRSQTSQGFGGQVVGSLSGIQNFGVQQSQGSRFGQGTGGFESSQQSGIKLTESGIMYQGPQIGGGNVGQTRSRVGQSSYTSGLGSGYVGYQSGQSGQSGVRYTGQGVQPESYGVSSRTQNVETLSASRQQDPKTISPATQSLYYEQYQGPQQVSRTYASGASGVIQSGQTPLSSSQHSSILRTPIESYKFTSPSPAGSKLTQSIIKKGEESLSKIQAQTPTSKKQETPKAEYKYYYGQQQPKKQ